MNSTNYRMPARRFAVSAAAVVLAAGPAALAGAGSAHATGDHGRASAFVLRTGLDVSLLDKTVDVPLAVSLNEVRAPRSADRTALTTRLDGVDRGRPFNVLRADVAESRATVEDGKAEGFSRLAHARVHVPGLPLLSVVELDAVSSTATCEAGRRPVATVNVPGSVRVLGKRVRLTAGGPTEVRVPGVGEVRLELSRTRTTTRTAAASALELKVSINPLKLNVAEVEGTLTLAGAACRTPAARAAQEAEPSEPAEHTEPSEAAEEPGPAEPSEPAAEPVTEVKPQGAHAEAGLAETGGSSTTPYIAGGAVALLAAGGGAVALSRRRRG
ncbi:SCO1860 family LAETG-anchored protein [Streptomyces sp. NPDC048566]|uniref:SCO1860 family LAETG-anchored protein n=1 Tax=Streptomyces sp. NPDC048566 TaxID=3365569 RepID=UPI0037235E82